MKVLFQGQTANGQSSEERISQRDTYYRLSASGTIGGGSVALEVKDPFDAWIPVATLSAVGGETVRLRSGDIVRATLAGSTGANINVALKPLGS